MKSLYLLPFILVLASANLAVDFSTYDLPPRNFFSCLSQQNVTKVILEISDEQGNINQNFLKSYIRAHDANIKDFDAIVRINDSLDVEQIWDKISDAIPASFNGTVWLDVQDNQNLWSLNVSQRLQYLSLSVRIGQYYKDAFKVGVVSSADAWTHVMGTQGVGNEILNNVQVWYSNDNEAQNFHDFEYAGFGTWKAAAAGMKSYTGDTMICNYYASSVNYYEVPQTLKLRLE